MKQSQQLRLCCFVLTLSVCFGLQFQQITPNNWNEYQSAQLPVLLVWLQPEKHVELLQGLTELGQEFSGRIVGGYVDSREVEEKFPEDACGDSQPVEQVWRHQV